VAIVIKKSLARLFLLIYLIGKKLWVFARNVSVFIHRLILRKYGEAMKTSEIKVGVTYFNGEKKREVLHIALWGTYIDIFYVEVSGQECKVCTLPTFAAWAKGVVEGDGKQ
jgi:hypothetical protein